MMILKELGEFGLLFTGLAGKLVESLVDTYLNPEGLSMLIEKSEKKIEQYDNEEDKDIPISK